MKKRLNVLITTLIISIVLFISACGPVLDETETVVNKYLHAAIENDLGTLQETVDPDYQDEVMQAIFFQIGLAGMINFFGLGGTEAEYTELDLDTIGNDGQYAIVHVKGKLKVKSLGTQMIVPIEADVPLVKKNGTWYVTISRTPSP